MIEYVTKDDLELINFALNSGSDVNIQLTPKGIRIIRNTIKVLKRKDIEKDEFKDN